MLVLSQAPRENAPLTFTSVAAVSVWNPNWCVMASSTVLTVQMRVWDALNATALVNQLLTAITSVSAPQMDRSVHNRRVSCCCHGMASKGTVFHYEDVVFHQSASDNWGEGSRNMHTVF